MKYFLKQIWRRYIANLWHPYEMTEAEFEVHPLMRVLLSASGGRAEKDNQQNRRFLKVEP